MKILNLKVNHFGKLENKDCDFGEHINVVYGKNESGKSSLLKYIVGMLYGVSKNKNGKEISDLDKYTPWFSEDFSGKIKYKLDNGETFEVYREFKKKNPKIFNENSEEISKTFNMDKTKGNMFFYDQTKVEEELFLSSLVSQQQEVKLDQKSQNTLVQRISNLIGTGEDKVSYQKTIRILDKRLLEEVGTSRSLDRPINNVKRRINEIENEKEYLQPHVIEKYEIGKQKENIKIECEKIKREIEYLKELKMLEERSAIEKEKIEVNKRIEKEYTEKIEELKKKLEFKNKSNKNNKDKRLILPIIPSSISAIIAIILFYIIQNIKVILPIVGILVLLNLVYVILYIKNKYSENKEQTIIKNEQLQIDKEIEQAEANIQEQRNIINKLQEKLKGKESFEKERIKEKYIYKIGLKEFNLDNHNIIMKLNSLQEQYQNLVLKIKSLELEEKNILPRLDKLAGIEEELEGLKEEEKELELKREYIELAKETIMKSYEKMKNEISPKFANSISKQMEAISSGKYKNIKLNDENGFMVEIENGDYIPGENLSVGTIEQLYLSLRLSAVDDIFSEEMPILLDETFAYFDDERLENILKYLDAKYHNRQIIIFTCTNREKDALNKLKIEYNLVEM